MIETKKDEEKEDDEKIVLSFATDRDATKNQRRWEFYHMLLV